MTNAMLRTGLFGDLFCDKQVADAFGADALLGRMLMFEVAWTRALLATDAITPTQAIRALAALDAFDATTFRPDSDRDGLPVPALVTALRAGLAPEDARAIHTGATSQDVIDTAMVLTCLHVLDAFEMRLDHLLTDLVALEARVGAAPMLARTRMQTALPATAALRINAWARGLQGVRDRLPALRTDLAKVQIGGAIGAREMPQAEALVQHVAAALDLQASPVWHTDRSSMVSLGHWLTLVAGMTGKIGQDIALMAQQGVDEVKLAGSGGSSAMPHKQNPILAETLVALARHVGGMQGTLAQAMIHEQERSGAAWALEWLTLPSMLESTGAALRHARTLVGQVQRMGTPD